MEAQDLVLKNVSLCSIVRDEMMNPAGGIIDFIECIVPYVEKAVIVDTGSLDRTKHILEESAKKYPNLKIFDKQFEDYASSRNFSLSKVETKIALVLDADERIFRKELLKLKGFLKINKSKDINLFFDILNIYADGEIKPGGNNPRMFHVKDKKYQNEGHGCWEYLFVDGSRIYDGIERHIEIIHFLPDKEGETKKRRYWYDSTGKKAIAPSQRKGFVTWKKLNPLRAKYS
ncbi:MAG: glycosyltransferase [Candidatus Nanoarchaeia archaeon]